VKATEGCLNDGNNIVRMLGRDAYSILQKMFPAEASGLYNRLNSRAKKALNQQTNDNNGETTNGGGGLILLTDENDEKEETKADKLKKIRRRTTTVNEQILEFAAISKQGISTNGSGSSLHSTPSNSNSQLLQSQEKEKMTRGRGSHSKLLATPMTKRTSNSSSISTSSNNHNESPSSSSSSPSNSNQDNSLNSSKDQNIRNRVPTEEMLLLSLSEMKTAPSSYRPTSGSKDQDSKNNIKSSKIKFNSSNSLSDNLLTGIDEDDENSSRNKSTESLKTIDDNVENQSENQIQNEKAKIELLKKDEEGDKDENDEKKNESKDYHINVDIDSDVDVEEDHEDLLKQEPFRGLTDDIIPTHDITPPPFRRDSNTSQNQSKTKNIPPPSPSELSMGSHTETISYSTKQPSQEQAQASLSLDSDNSMQPPPNPSPPSRSVKPVRRRSSEDDAIHPSSSPSSSRSQTTTTTPTNRPLPSKRRSTKDTSRSPQNATNNGLNGSFDNQPITSSSMKSTPTPLPRRRSSKKLIQNNHSDPSCQSDNNTTTTTTTTATTTSPKSEAPKTKITRGGNFNKPDAMEISISLAKARELLMLDMMDEQALNFVNNKILLQPYGILGKRLTKDEKTVLTIGQDPTHKSRRPGGDHYSFNKKKQQPYNQNSQSTICLVDSCGLHHIQPPGRPRGAHGSSGALYNWLGIDFNNEEDSEDSSFPKAVIKNICHIGDAKFHVYHRDGIHRRLSYKNINDEICNNHNENNDDDNDITNDSGAAYVIHALGPDFRNHPASISMKETLAIDALAKTYYSILYEFIQSGTMVLRLLPISGGIFSGPFHDLIPILTYKALQVAFCALKEYDQIALLKLELHMCIYAENDLSLFYDAGFQPSIESKQYLHVSMSPPRSANTSIIHNQSRQSRNTGRNTAMSQRSMSGCSNTTFSTMTTSFHETRQHPSSLLQSSVFSTSSLTLGINNNDNNGNSGSIDILFDRYQEAVEKDPVKKDLLLVDLRLDAQAWIKDHTHHYLESPSSPPSPTTTSTITKSHISSNVFSPSDESRQTFSNPSPSLRGIVNDSSHIQHDVAMETRSTLLDVLKIKSGMDDINKKTFKNPQKQIDKQQEYIRLLESIIVHADFPRTNGGASNGIKSNGDDYASGGEGIVHNNRSSTKSFGNNSFSSQKKDPSCSIM